MLADPDAEVRRVDRRRAGRPQGRARRRTSRAHAEGSGRACSRRRRGRARRSRGGHDWAEPRGCPEGLRLAGAAGSGARARHARSRSPPSPDLSAALRDNDGRVRQMAAWALGQLEAPEAVTPLSAALRDEEQQVRIRAAWALGQIENADAVPALAAALKDGSAKVRETSAWALGQIEQGTAIDPLASRPRGSGLARAQDRCVGARSDRAAPRRARPRQGPRPTNTRASAKPPPGRSANSRTRRRFPG